MKSILLFAIYVFNAHIGLSQPLPFENDTLNYRLVGFSFPPNETAREYHFEIADGRINNKVDFSNNVIFSKKLAERKIIHAVPAFGKDYTWRVTYLNKKGKKIGQSPLHHFTTARHRYVDSTKFRVQLIDTAIAHRQLLVFYDNTRTLRDMRGEPLWFLPDIPELLNEDATVRDLKLTPQGTITFLMGQSAVEVDYDGRVLWKAPNDGKVSNDTSEYYHHEFTRLPNGNYMVAGQKHVLREIPDIVDTSAYINQWNVEQRGNKFYNKVVFGTLIEYDTAKNVVWSWVSSDHFSDEDLFTRRIQGKIMTSTHHNSFYFDTATQTIYTSFRDANRVVKIRYPSGEVLAKYGKMPDFTTKDDNPLFQSQHNCRINREGNLYLFNNNSPLRNSGVRPEEKVSYVNIFKEVPGSRSELIKIWEFPCNIDTFARPCATGGGSVFELPDTSILVSMGSVNRVFIVSRDKKVLWNAITLMAQGEATNWVPHDNYRISPVQTTEELETLIFKKL